MTTDNGLMGWAPGDMYYSEEHHVEVGDQIATFASSYPHHRS